MAPEEWRSSAPLIHRLLEEFYNFSFYKAVHLLESLSPEKELLGRTLVPGREAVRFSVKPGLVFPPSDISNLRRSDEAGLWEMEVAFMGLIGPSGVLPYWFNELALERLRRKDHSLTSFFDIFHHRLISLFYLAWKKHRFTVNYLPGARDRLSGYLLSLMGLGTPGLAGPADVPKESLLFYSGLLSRQVPCAAAIAATVEYFAGTSAEVEQFIDRTLLLDPEDRTRIGQSNGQLGVDAMCGSCVYESQTKFRVNLGPMGYASFLRFMPTGDMLRSVFSLIRHMVGVEYEFEVRVFLKREEVPPCVLGLQTSASPRLGWSTWVKAPDVLMQDTPYATFQDPGV